MKIAIAHFFHETVTFLDSETTREDFTYDNSPLSGEALLRSGHDSYLGGFVKVAREFHDVELVGLTSPMASKRGTGSGWITADAYEWFVAKMINDLSRCLPVNGVFLALHGAMAVRGIDRPEADIARQIRSVVGPDATIAATFDPHGNEDDRFFDFADLAFCAKYYPHYDEYHQGTRAARTLIRAIRLDYRPVTRTLKVPILTPTIMQCTDGGPWGELVNRALVWEARAPDLFVNVFFGFPWGDAADAGMTIQTITNADEDLASRAVQDVADFAWRRRKELTNAVAIYSVRDGVKGAAEFDGKEPVIIADHSDRSGRATWVLEEILSQHLSKTLIATITDTSLISQIRDSGARPGDDFDMKIGGGPELSDGKPVHIKGKILKIAHMDHLQKYRENSPWLVVGFGEGNIVIVTPFLTQIVERSVFDKELGISPAHFRAIVLKSRVHFRRGFVDDGFCTKVFIVEPDRDFLGTTRLERLPYHNLNIKNYHPYSAEQETLDREQ